MPKKLRNVTVTLDEETARWARVEAARRDTSVSKLLGGLLHSEMLHEARYEAAKLAYMAQEPAIHRCEGQSLPSREELHDRVDLR
jgi:hypothetical protein